MRGVQKLGIACFFLLRLTVAAQQKVYTRLEDADELFDTGNYPAAIEAYRDELRKRPEDAQVKARLGLCYLNTRISREDAVYYLRQACTSPKADANLWFAMGRAFHLNNQIDEAIAAFKKYKEMKPRQAGEADRMIAQCETAARAILNPVDVTLQNLGVLINSPGADYNPFIDRDETILAFTSRRRENMGNAAGGDILRNSDIYLSTMESGNWTAARNAGKEINTTLDEQVTGLRPDGLEMYLYADQPDKYGDIYFTGRKDSKNVFGKPKAFDESVNRYIETSGTVSEDGMLMFFSRKTEPAGTTDLYLSRRLPTGKWAIPVKLPETVNSPFNEENPFLSPDGETLYFSSDGHNTMGGYDLFRSKWNREDNSFSVPENLGYPVNTTDDDRSICVTPDNRLAYVSSFRPNGAGDLDIYRVRYNTGDEIPVVYTGRVFLGDTILSNQPRSYAMEVIVTNKKTYYEYTFVPNSRTGRLLMALPGGEYLLTVKLKGYQHYAETMVVSDMGPLNLERRKDIILKKPNEAAGKPQKK